MESGTLSFEDAARVLAEAKIQEKPVALAPLQGGANNRVFRIDFAKQSPLILKSYFQHPNDRRPRLKTEFEFLLFAWQEGVRTIPQPLYQDPENNCALYTCLPGALAAPEHATGAFIKAAADFVLKLNRHKKRGSHLSAASEGCSCIQDYLHAAERRLDMLCKVASNTAIHRDLHRFLQTELTPLWEKVLQDLSRHPLHTLEPDLLDRILTPSDFGLHNVLVSPQGEFGFIDFEYAGWDDPAKTICDFFLQPKVPIPLEHFDLFAKPLSALTLDPDKTWKRAHVLLAVCHIKWCCMILNVFLPTDKARRSFAHVHLPTAQITKLEQAKQYLQKIGVRA